MMPTNAPTCPNRPQVVRALTWSVPRPNDVHQMWMAISGGQDEQPD